MQLLIFFINNRGSIPSPLHSLAIYFYPSRFDSHSCESLSRPFLHYLARDNNNALIEYSLIPHLSLSRRLSRGLSRIINMSLIVDKCLSLFNIIPLSLSLCRRRSRCITRDLSVTPIRAPFCEYIYTVRAFAPAIKKGFEIEGNALSSPLK